MRDGITSKKFWFAVGVIAIAFLYAVLAATKVQDLKSMYQTFTGVLEFVTAAYLTGNIANKWVAAKAEPQVAPTGKKQQSLQSADPLDRDTPTGGR